MAETSLGLFLFSFFFFQQKRIGWVVFAGRGNYGNAACHPDKERDSCGCGKRNNWAQDEKTQKNKIKLAHDGYL
jgi:hypothetical protein